MGGWVVNEGVTPRHVCDEIYAPGRPSEFRLNPGAVWLCECGKFYQRYEQPVVDMEGDPAGTEPRWRRVKDAQGTPYKRVDYVPAISRKILFWEKCEQCRWVPRGHKHTRWE